MIEKIKTAEILCVGTEILIGDIVNTNAAYLSKRLAELGISQYYQGVVGDNPDRLRARIKEALSRCDLLLLGGGLGPTYDDLTKETVCSLLGVELVFHEPTYRRLEDFCRIRGISLSQRDKQAYLPRGCTVFTNYNGTAPGCAVTLEDKMVVMLPGPPREQIPMIDGELIPFLSQFTDGIIVSHDLRLCGIGEADAARTVSDLIENAENPTIAPYCGEGDMRFRVTARGKDRAEAENTVKKGIDLLYSSPIAGFIVGCDITVEEAVIAELKKRGLKITCAESCTGGLIAQMLTSVSGASEVFEYGFVTYSERAKKEILGVDAQTLEKYTVYSENVAREMASGALRKATADIAVSITGIAGPGGGTDEKPVGTVYIGISGADGTFSKEFHFTGNRDHIRALGAKYALNEVLKTLREVKDE